MTASNLDEVRRAAERIVVEGLDAWYQEAIDVAEYALATIPANPTAPIDAEWLREVWGFEDGCTKRFSVSKDGWHWYPQCGNLEPALGIEGMIVYSPFATRHQFTQLATALGLQPKGDV